MLLKKLINMGVNLTLVKWIQGFLTGRQQHVRVGHCQSRTIMINTVVSQECVLS
ncbi:hypothetical protein FQN60_008315, partial [Etheostoma spectabile]